MKKCLGQGPRKISFSKNTTYDAIIIGGGISGLSIAARLQKNNLKTCIIESHSKLGGCAGYFERNGFSFDVGTTAFVDFEENGIGWEFLKEIGIDHIPGNIIKGYKMHLPESNVYLFKDQAQFQKEREKVFGTSENLTAFWKLMDQLSDVFWEASRKGIKLPLQNFQDLVHNIRCVKVRNLHLSRYITWTVADALTHFKLWDNLALVGMLRCLVEDTLQCNDLNNAPLINASLGITIRLAGLLRPEKGAKGFWEILNQKYKELGGEVFLKTKVKKVEKSGIFTVYTPNQVFHSKILISSVPIQDSKKLLQDIDEISSSKEMRKLDKFIQKNKDNLGGGIVLFMGVPEEEVIKEEMEEYEKHKFPVTYHQLLQNNFLPLGNGNNMFISVSMKDDKSAPSGYRSVMISTHCGAKEWFEIKELEDYRLKKKEIALKLLNFARRVYPNLGKSVEQDFIDSLNIKSHTEHNGQKLVFEVSTPRTVYNYTKRELGSVGGYLMNMRNSNFFAIPQNLLAKNNVYLVGDTTWPGLGTVACILGTKIAAKEILERFKFEKPSILKSFSLCFNHLGDFFKSSEDIHKILLKYSLKNLSPVIPIAFNPFDVMYLVKDADLIHEILIKNSAAFQNRTSFPIVDYTYFKFIKNVLMLKNNTKDVKFEKNMGGITFTNGKVWKENRSIGVKLMNDFEFLCFCVPHLIQTSREMINEMKKVNPQELHLNIWISNLAIEVIGHVVFATKFNTLNPEKNDSKQMVHHVRKMLDGIQSFLYSPIPSQFYDIFKTKKVKELDESIQILAEFGYNVTMNVLEKSKDCLTSKLMLLYPEMSMENAQALLMDLLGAGHDTTANTVIFAIGSIIENDLMKNEDFQKEINFIESIFPDEFKGNENIPEFIQAIEKQTPILSDILRETLRLYPLGAAFSRVAVNDVELSGNIKFKQGDKLLISPYVMGRLPEYWKENSEKFTIHFDEINDRASIPFGGGSRGCLGGRFGILEAKIILIILLKNLKIKKNEKCQPLDSTLAFTLRTKHPILVDIEFNK